jgi:hypothetical protein
MQDSDEADRLSRAAMESDAQSGAAVPRRRFMEISAVATAGALGLHALGDRAEGGSVAEVSGGTPAPAEGVIMLDRVKVSVFEPCIGDTFVARAGDGSTHQLELIEAEALEPPTGASHMAVRQDPFSLIFRAPASSQLGQGMCTMSHAKLGELALFIVPIGPGREGTGLRYQAVIA